MTDSVLSQPQVQVICALSKGVNTTDAAAQAGVDRQTIAQWRRNSLPFREALAHAQYDRAMFFREKAEEMVDLAFETLDALLTDPKASASVRLKAAIFIIEMATTPPPPKEQVPSTLRRSAYPGPRLPPSTKTHKLCIPRTTMHKVHKPKPPWRRPPPKRSVVKPPK